MIWVLLALSVSIWLVAIFYIIKGWGEGGLEPEEKVKKVEPKKEIEANKEVEVSREIEIPIGELPDEEIQPPTQIDLEGFYQEFGKVNVVEFPAEYIDRDKVTDLSGNKIGIVEFAKNCYSEIGFQCIDTVMVEEKGGRAYRVNIFDLILDHYASTEEGFITFFGRLKERLGPQIQSINSHPDITPLNKKALVGRYEALPQLVVWNDRELFLVAVKSKYDTLSKKEIALLKEFIMEKKLFKARIFRVTQRQQKSINIKEIRPVVERRPFTKEETGFLMENKDKFTNEELAQRLDRSVDSVTHKLSRLGIARQSYEWTKDKDNFLKFNITKFSYRELAEKLGTTIPSVRARCKKINIKKI